MHTTLLYCRFPNSWKIPGSKGAWTRKIVSIKSHNKFATVIYRVQHLHWRLQRIPALKQICNISKRKECLLHKKGMSASWFLGWRKSASPFFSLTKLVPFRTIYNVKALSETNILSVLRRVSSHTKLSHAPLPQLVQPLSGPEKQDTIGKA